MSGARKPLLRGALREPIWNRERRFQGFDTLRNPPFAEGFAPRSLWQQPCDASSPNVVGQIDDKATAHGKGGQRVWIFQAPLLLEGRNNRYE